MEEDTRNLVAFLTSQLVFVAALIHLAVGLLNWLRWLGAGFLVPQDARWPVFVASALVVFAGMYVAHRAENKRPFYLAGAVVMLGYALAYFGWHLGGHRLLIVAGQSGGSPEGVSVEWFLDHLLAGPVEFVSIVVETLAAVGLTVLFLTAEGGESDR